ncbi:MAG TPA: diaminopimelate decarboxylase [Caulobacteraceae bacterium]|nr:diaminopimelate decarboxylase [Caulobacteraceae bacterium]
MNHFEARDGALACESVPLARVAEAVGTPAYVYSTATLVRHVQVFREAVAGLGPPAPIVAYAVKANSNLSVLKTLFRLGVWADTVSEGEIRRALAAGLEPGRIVFSGVGKTDAELAFAVDSGVAEINVEAEPELDRLSAVAGAKGARQPIAIRVNPDVAAGGHAKIATGQADAKFGVSLSEAARLYKKASNLPGVRPLGVACHIGSQIADLSAFEVAARTMRGLVESLRRQGLAVERLDMGGGLAVPYFNQPDPPSPVAYASALARVFNGLDIQLAFEPGRLIVANAGVLLARVIHVHERPEGRRFLVLDAAMNDLVRPAMYEAYHELRPVIEPARDTPRLAFDVVGPVCETGDTFARERLLPPLKAGDFVAFMSAGAYGAVMASEYNSRLLVPEVLVDGDRFAVVRPRPTYEQMLAAEPIAPWL